MKDKFLIKGLDGKRPLTGSVVVGGAKNAALKLMAATVLFEDEVTLKNVPYIEDVKRMSDLLKNMGVDVVSKDKHSYIFKTPSKCDTKLSTDISKKLRASIALIGPVLSRFGSVSFPHPGGCVIGARPIDLYLDGFKSMGATVSAKDENYVIEASEGKLNGATIFLRNQSVTATETFMMAGVLANGETVIKNASLEPEVKDLANFLVSSGADIKGIGTTTLVVNGGELLSYRGKEHTVLPDRIEAGSFIILAALAASELEVKECNPLHLESLIETLRMSGVKMDVGKSSIKVFGETPVAELKSVSIKTHEYPGFPTDLQAPMTVFLTQVNGESMVFETIFEGRLYYTESLSAMGAKITTMDPHRIIVNGPSSLHGKVLESPDLRAGLAFIIAAIVASGDSVIHNVYNIDRGYEDVEGRLRAIGVDITRVSE